MSDARPRGFFGAIDTLPGACPSRRQDGSPAPQRASAALELAVCLEEAVGVLAVDEAVVARIRTLPGPDAQLLAHILGDFMRVLDDEDASFCPRETLNLI